MPEDATAEAPSSPSETPSADVEKSPRLSEEPLNGGRAWLTVFASFLLFVITWGPSIAFGLFQNYYQSSILSNFSSSNISWIGGLNAFFLITTGVVAGPYFDRGYMRELMTLGCFMAIFGMMMLSLATEYYQIILALGVCNGIGAGLVYVPALAFVNTSFSSRRAIAMGLVTAGASIGGLIFPIIFLQLQPQIGYPWTIRVFGFIMLACTLIALPLIFLGPRPQKPATVRQLIDWPAFKEPAFVADCIANFLMFMAYFIPFFYIPTFSATVVGDSVNTGFYQLSTMNAASAVARVTSAVVSQKIGAINLLVSAVAASTVLLYGWLGISSSAALWVWVVLFGFVSGALISTNPIVMAHPVISPSPAVMGTRMGMQWVFAGIGVLLGAPIGGSLLAGNRGPGQARTAFQKLEGFDAAMMTGGLLCLLFTAVAIWRHKPSK